MLPAGIFCPSPSLFASGQLPPPPAYPACPDLRVSTCFASALIRCHYKMPSARILLGERSGRAILIGPTISKRRGYQIQAVAHYDQNCHFQPKNFSVFFFIPNKANMNQYANKNIFWLEVVKIAISVKSLMCFDRILAEFKGKNTS